MLKALSDSWLNPFPYSLIKTFLNFSYKIKIIFLLHQGDFSMKLYIMQAQCDIDAYYVKSKWKAILKLLIFNTKLSSKKGLCQSENQHVPLASQTFSHLTGKLIQIAAPSLPGP